MRWTPILCLLIAAISSTVSAGETSLDGVVVDSLTGDPVQFVSVTMVDAEGFVLGWASSGEDGTFRIEGDAGRAQVLVLRRMGYHVLRHPVAPAGLAEIRIALKPSPYTTAPIVVSATRRRETSFDAPASVSVINSREVVEQQNFTPMDPIENTVGVSFARKGLLGSTSNTRFNSGVMNGGILVLQDERMMRMPTLQLNIPYFLSATPGDIERVEVVRGPAASMYGPEGGGGVVHIVTKSPIDYQGTSVSIGGGERSTFESWFRHAGLITENIGYQLSSRYFRGEDWPLENKKLNQKVDKDVEFGTSSMQVEWRPETQTRLVARGGTAHAFKIIDQAPAGYVQAKDFNFSYAQAYFQRGGFTTNFTWNATDDGGSYFVPGESPYVDRSGFASAQVKYAKDIRTGAITNQITSGIDWRSTIIRSEGTLTGRFEDDDTVTELGGYAHVTSIVSQNVDLVGSVRVDHHDRLKTGTAYPFKVGVVFEPFVSQHCFRATYSRNRGAPSPLLLFQDSRQGGQPPFFQLSQVAVPKDGWHFRYDDKGTPLMRSALVPAGVDDFGTADATRTWAAIQTLVPQLASVPAPTSGDVSTDLKTWELDSKSFVPFSLSELKDIEQLDRVLSEYGEVGYKGLVTDRLEVGIDSYVRYTKSYTGPIEAVTPNVFYDNATLEEYLAGYMTPAEAAAIAQEVAALPVGTVAPSEIGASYETILAYKVQREKPVTDWGYGVSARFALFDEWVLSSNYTYTDVNEDADYTMRPKHRGSARVEYRHASDTFAAAVQAKGQSHYTMRVGRFRGFIDYYAVLDLDIMYRPGWLPHGRIFLNASNVFDERHIEVAGAKELGRLVTARVQFDL